MQKKKVNSGDLSKETQNTTLKEYVHAYVHCIVIYNSQEMKATGAHQVSG